MHYNDNKEFSPLSFYHDCRRIDINWGHGGDAFHRLHEKFRICGGGRPGQSSRRLYWADLRSAHFHRRGKGLFQEEGLDVSLVKCEWANYKDVLALGGFDVTHHLVMYFLKPVEQGLDVKFTGGIHRGCLRVHALKKANIRSIEELRGKRIGVPGMGTPPFIFANRVLARMASIRRKKSPGLSSLPANSAWLSTRATSMPSLTRNRLAVC